MHIWLKYWNSCVQAGFSSGCCIFATWHQLQLSQNGVDLAYDTGTEGVLIRFLGMIRLTIPLGRLYAGAWLSGTTVFVSERNSIVWIPEEDCDDPGTEEERERIMLHYGWIEAEEICWAVPDAEGNPVEMPADRIDKSIQQL